jgi:hypothetical protein
VSGYGCTAPAATVVVARLGSGSSMPSASGFIAATAASIEAAVGATKPAPLWSATGVRSSARADARSVIVQTGP